MAERQTWSSRQWKAYKDDGQQGRKRAGRHQDGPRERSPGRDSRGRRWEERADGEAQAPQLTDSQCMPPPAPVHGQGQASSSCSGVTSISQVLARADEWVADSETSEQVQTKLAQIRLAASRLPPRDHAWKTLKREELSLMDCLNKKGETPRGLTEQGVVLQKEYHEQCAKTMNLWEKRQRRIEEAKTAQSNLDAAERAYTCGVITKDVVIKRLQAHYEEVNKEQDQRAKLRQAQALRDLTPRGLDTLGPPAVQTVVGARAMAAPTTATYPRSQTIGRWQGSVAEVTRARPKCPVLATMPTVETALTSWTGVQQAARELAAATQSAEADAGRNPYSVESIRSDVDEAVRLAQRAKEYLGGAITRAGVRLHSAQTAESPRALLTPRQAIAGTEATDGGEASAQAAGMVATEATGAEEEQGMGAVVIDVEDAAT